MKNKLLILIPARYGSTRFPGKMLSKIKGRPLIKICYDNMKDLNKTYDADIFVITDSFKIENIFNEKNERLDLPVCLRIDEITSSGSERIYLAFQKYFSGRKYDLIINVQGDEPLLNSDDLIKLIDFHLASKFEIATIASLQQGDNDFNDKNNVKVVISKNKKALYFSRQAIPFERDVDINNSTQKLEESGRNWLLHVGVYSFTQKALEKFNSFETSYLENLEKLEQLRALENDMSIGVKVFQKKFIGVDTEEDINKVKSII